MDYVSNNKVKDSFGPDMVLNFGINGEEYRLLGGILDLIYRSVRERGTHTNSVIATSVLDLRALIRIL